MYIDREGWLVPDHLDDPGVLRYPTERITTLIGGEPQGLVLHTTDDTPNDAYCERLCRRIQKRPTEGQRSASFHLVVSRKGVIHQCAPFLVGTWHVKGTGKINGKTQSVNRSTVGWEFENGGRVKLLPGSKSTYVTYGDSQKPFSNPKNAVERGTVQMVAGVGALAFQTFTIDQYDAFVRMLRACAARFHWTRNQIYTHASLNPGRREDPGPIFLAALPQLLDRAFGEA